MKTIIITGAAGYIGSHTLLEILDNSDYHILAIDNYANSSPETYERIKRINPRTFHQFYADYGDKERMKEIIQGFGPIAGIIHFGAYKSVPESMKMSIPYFQNNVSGLINLLELIEEFKIPKFIFSSSCAVYGSNAQDEINEHTPHGMAQSPYAATKQLGEQILEQFASTHSWFEYSALRYFNPAGYDASGLLGEAKFDEAQGLIPLLCKAAYKGRPIHVFGTQLPTRDGSCIRDFVHVSDVARAHLLALNKLFEEQPNTRVINLGSGNGHSVLEVIDAFVAMGIDLNVQYSGPREGDIVSIYASNAKARLLLDWSPKFTLKEILESSWLNTKHYYQEALRSLVA